MFRHRVAASRYSVLLSLQCPRPVVVRGRVAEEKKYLDTNTANSFNISVSLRVVVWRLLGGGELLSKLLFQYRILIPVVEAYLVIVHFSLLVVDKFCNSMQFTSIKK